jgi:glutamyl-Q tRNA(Asp) synthetase
VAALASYLDARAHQGAWLIRIEDLDSARQVPGAEAAILETLARLGLESDEPVLRQSTRLAVYQAALQRLFQDGLLYRCICGRSEASGMPYSGRCRDVRVGGASAAYRLRLMVGSVSFADRVQGDVSYDNSLLGDPIVFRKDGIPAYQLAVVVDDAAQAITHVVRGADLLQSTGWQTQIATALGAPTPAYAHIPLVVEPDGSKLAKSQRSLPIEGLAPAQALLEGLSVLNQAPPPELAAARPDEILAWAVSHWDLQRLQGQTTVRLP